MDIHELSERLRQLGARVPEKTLVRWAYTEGVISRPEQHKEGKGRGKLSDWCSTAVEEAAAVWAVREKWREMHSCKKKRLSKDKIEVIKRAASVIDERPFAIYALPTITGPLSTQRLDPKDIEMKFVGEDCYGLDLFPGADNAEKVDCLNKLLISWVAAREKVRAWKTEGIKNQVESEWGESEWEDHLTDVDFSQIDPWNVAVPCPWPIDKPARVSLIWWSWDGELSKPPFPWQTELSESDADDLILLENYTDTRAFFKIDVTNHAGWVTARLEDIRSLKRRDTSAGPP
jgi:hypothetical protein